MNEISRKELYQIINRAIAKSVSAEDVSLTNEINIYQKKYADRLKKDPQLDIFEEAPALPKELKDAVLFCENLEIYKKALDIYTKEDDLTISICRQLCNQLKEYAPQITEENRAICRVIFQNLQRRLPEYRDRMIIRDYTKEVESIINENETYKKNKTTAGKDHLEQSTLAFFRNFDQSEDIKTIKACKEKIDLYEKCLDIVNFLPKHKYGRAARFMIKRDLNLEIYKMAQELGPDYVVTAQRAYDEANKFEAAVTRTIKHAQKNKDKSVLSIDLINKRARDNWLNK